MTKEKQNLLHSAGALLGTVGVAATAAAAAGTGQGRHRRGHGLQHFFLQRGWRIGQNVRRRGQLAQLV